MSKKHKNQKPDNSPIVSQRDKIKQELLIKEFPWTARQKELINLILSKESKIIFIDGPAGSSKTLTSVYCALKLLNERRLSELFYIRTIIESASKSTGYLPGTTGEKIKPFMMPLEDKLIELLPKCEIDKLMKDERVKGIIINHLRGASFNAKFLLCDESQNLNFFETQTLVTRVGQFSKLIVCGDSMQSDIGDNSGFLKMMNLFNDDESKKFGIFTFKFTEEDIMRSEVVKFIVKKLKELK